MRFFLKTRKFKISVGVISVIIVLAIVIRMFSGMFSPGSGIIGMILSPIEQAFTAIGNAVDDFTTKLNDGDELLLKNKQLEEDISKLRASVAELEETRRENEFYKDYLEIKEQNPDFKFASAKVITKESGDIYEGFTVNVGSIDGVELYDPVIVQNYLVGYINEVGISTSKVITVLNPELSVGAVDSRTDDPGVVSGSAEYAKSGKTRFHRLSRSCSVAVGDYVVSSGEGVFPAGLLIGTVENIKSDSYSSSLYAVVAPFADFSSLRNVMVITDFSGKGYIYNSEAG